jgi:hypothetical protein
MVWIFVPQLSQAAASKSVALSDIDASKAAKHLLITDQYVIFLRLSETTQRFKLVVSSIHRMA